MQIEIFVVEGGGRSLGGGTLVSAFPGAIKHYSESLPLPIPQRIYKQFVKNLDRRFPPNYVCIMKSARKKS